MPSFMTQKARLFSPKITSTDRQGKEPSTHIKIITFFFFYYMIQLSEQHSGEIKHLKSQWSFSQFALALTSMATPCLWPRAWNPLWMGMWVDVTWT